MGGERTYAMDDVSVPSVGRGGVRPTWSAANGPTRMVVSMPSVAGGGGRLLGVRQRWRTDVKFQCPPWRAGVCGHSQNGFIQLTSLEFQCPP